MTRILLITEKIIASILIAWVGFLSYFLIGGVSALTDLSIIQPVLFLELVRIYQPLILLALLLIVGGFFLLFGKRLGWILTLASLIINGLLFLIPTEKGKSVLTDGTLITILVSLAFLSFMLFYILVLPAFRIRYKATKSTWITVAAIATLVLADKVILYLAS